MGFRGAFAGLGHGGGDSARARESFGGVGDGLFVGSDPESRVNFIAILVNGFGAGRCVAVVNG